MQPASICFASVLLAPYETITLLPVLASNVLACSSIASLRLAAARTVTSAALTAAEAIARHIARATDDSACLNDGTGISFGASDQSVIYSGIRLSDNRRLKLHDKSTER